jgi:AcrR family transcriptional regulator
VNTDPSRPRRGTPDETRARLVAAAAEEIEARGYFGTDSNRIARAAGYAPGSFYKHFADKRAVFLAVYESWVTAEWDAIAKLETPREIVKVLIEHHRRWKGFRASLRALVATDPEVRAFQRAQRARQLDTLARLRGRPRRADDLLLLLTMERVCDAIADGEVDDLGVPERTIVDKLAILIGIAGN